MPAKIREISNFVKATATLDEVKKFSVIIMTIVTSSRLSLNNLPKDHFSHVFIDEAGHATEPEAVIPIAGEI